MKNNIDEEFMFLISEEDKSIGRNIFLFENFTIHMAKSIVQELIRLDMISQEPINVIINSYGGSVVALNSILDGFNIVQSQINTVVMGDADSAGALLFSAGDRRYVGEHSRIMIHEVSAEAWGGFRDMENQMDQIRKVNERMLEVLAKNTGRSKEELKEVMFKSDVWMTPQQAITFGIADDILTKANKKALKFSEPMKHSYAIKFDEWNVNSKLSDVPILSVGTYDHALHPTFKLEKEDLQQYIKNFKNKVRGIDISIDYTHDNDDGTKAAAGWFKSLYTKENDTQLWGKVEWTPKAKKAIAEKEFKYYSPEFTPDSYSTEKGEKVKNVLLGGALTNRPFQKWGGAVKLSEPPNSKIKKENKMDKDAMILKLSEEYNIDVKALQTEAENAKKLSEELKNLKEKIEGVNVTKDENVNLKVQVEDLTKRIATSEEKTSVAEKEVVWSRLVKLGKVSDGTKKQDFATHKTAEELENYFKDRPAILHTKAVGESSSDDNVLTENEQSVLKSDSSLKKEDIIAARKIYNKKEGE